MSPRLTLGDEDVSVQAVEVFTEMVQAYSS